MGKKKDEEKKTETTQVEIPAVGEGTTIISKEFAVAFGMAQNVMENPAKNHTAIVKMKSGGTFSYKYAGLEETVACAKAALNANRIFIMQPPVTNDAGLIGVRTELVFDDTGEVWDRGTLLIRASDDPQKVGSIITYLRRYGLTSAVGMVAEEDDDGQTGRDKGPKPAPAQASAPAKQASPPAKPAPAAAAKSAQPAAAKPTGRTPVEHWNSIKKHYDLFEGIAIGGGASALFGATEFESGGEMVGGYDDLKKFYDSLEAKTDIAKKNTRRKIVCHNMEKAYAEALTAEVAPVAGDGVAGDNVPF